MAQASSVATSRSSSSTRLGARGRIRQPLLRERGLPRTRRRSATRAHRRRSPGPRSRAPCDGRCDHVYHFAANPDIAKAATEPGVDFWQGRISRTTWSRHASQPVPAIIYASGSGVYGDQGTRRSTRPRAARPDLDVRREQARGRRMLAAYCHMFGMPARRLPLRQRGRPASDARRHLRLRPTAARAIRRASRFSVTDAEQVVHPRRRRGRGDAACSATRLDGLRSVQRGHRRLHHRRARSPISLSKGWDCATSGTSTREAARLEGRCTGRSLQQRQASRPRLAVPAHVTRGAPGLDRRQHGRSPRSDAA